MAYSAKTKHFFKDVFEVVRLIPEGRVTSYGAVAKYLGSGKSARMVGWAMNASFREVEYVPAHRVVNSQGLLTGRSHFGPSNEMELLLNKEGIQVKNEKIIEFQKYFWDPALELTLDE